MEKKQVMEIIELFNIEYYNLNDGYVCLKGINGQVTTIKFNDNPITSIKSHLIQMGRDSLKMDLNYLLNITTHN
jgi:hypothetical protein